MDSIGWRAHRKAQQDDDYYQRQGQRGPDGKFVPVEEVGPLPDGSHVGGIPMPRAGPPSLPPRSSYLQRSSSDSKTGHVRSETSTSIVRSSSAYMAQLPAAERARMQKAPRTDPHLQFMVGPLLRYDTVDENGVWHGAVMIVTADSGSSYEPHPVLTYQWDLEGRARPEASQQSSELSFDLGPHPADPHSTAVYSATPESEGLGYGDYKAKMGAISEQTQRVTGQEIYVYAGNGGTFTFWRFPIHIQLGSVELCIKYSINKSVQLSFFVPALKQNMRWATYSCNGFSAGVNQEEFKGPGYKSGYDPMWFDLLRDHAKEPFHVLVGGGDQLYCDALTREPEMQDWIHHPNAASKLAYIVSPEMSACIDRFFFNHYCASFRNGAFARANSTIPMLNMCGKCSNIQPLCLILSHPDDLQSSPVFLAIGTRAYFFYLLFQCFINPHIDGLDDRRGAHPFKSLILGVQGPYVGLPSHSCLSYMGPNIRILMLDCRAERKKDRVCSSEEYTKVMGAIDQLPPHVEHLIIQIGIPIAYPRMVFMEAALDSKLNPLTAIARTGQAITGFVNKFNGEAELLDDLNDHWTAKTHKQERNWLIQQLQSVSKRNRLRITFLSGDVHCAAVGAFRTLPQRVGGKSGSVAEIRPATDHRYMINVITSAIVNTPPPIGVIAMVSTFATKTHKTLHHADTDEIMIPLFTREPDGTPREKNKFIMGRRNWCAVRWDQQSGELVFDIRVEKGKGLGESVGYEVRAPPPQWVA
ncbi:hypothetical protein L210DRAFT_849761 [Boletus edulis BED1]|uniref:PhoD-like phosphatase domain-containing protein n=1 Tax=Boletus edulis BED1 TaxID=1328754 RepID=A0AAD4C4F0_BOLED|nr:hypothetical protein L210DRAFT_849761 [Boletus edulis BED1]